MEQILPTPATFNYQSSLAGVVGGHFMCSSPSMGNVDCFLLVTVMFMQPQILRVYTYNNSDTTRKYCVAAILPYPCLLQSLYTLSYKVF